MKMRRKLIKKLILATILIIISAIVTVVIKEALDTQDPEAALPIIEIKYDSNEINSDNIYRAGYDWSFFTTVERWQAPNIQPQDLPIVPQEVPANAKFNISFTSTPTQIDIYRASGQQSEDFLKIETETMGEFYAPGESGVYLYRLRCVFGSKGEIQYYFALSVT